MCPLYDVPSKYFILDDFVRPPLWLVIGKILCWEAINKIILFQIIMIHSLQKKKRNSHHSRQQDIDHSNLPPSFCQKYVHSFLDEIFQNWWISMLFSGSLAPVLSWLLLLLCAGLNILLPPPAPLLSPAAHGTRGYKWNPMIGTKHFLFQ